VAIGPKKCQTFENAAIFHQKKTRDDKKRERKEEEKEKKRAMEW